VVVPQSSDNEPTIRTKTDVDATVLTPAFFLNSVLRLWK
jgi:hypothetical protein